MAQRRAFRQRAGRFVKRESIERAAPDSFVVNGERVGLRRVLYALPGEKWRIDAYLKLWETLKTTGWTEALELEEGRLLGYTDWQNEIHIKRHCAYMAQHRPAGKSNCDI